MIFFTILITLLAGFAGLALYLYYWKRGQFEDSEDVKYQLFRQNDAYPPDKK
jgi:cbb3-type cytochrome oxidase maturation protein